MPTVSFPAAATAAAVKASRSRPPSEADLAQIPWLARLDAEERQRVAADLRVVTVARGELVCRIGRPVTYWFGVIDGLLKMSNDSAMGMPILFKYRPDTQLH